MADQVILMGASTRAAAFSALRAGLWPWCADLFADADLASRCPVRRVPGERYPEGFLDCLAEAPPGPWLYTGGMENRPALVAAMSRLRPLWGNDAAALQRARSPAFLASLLARACHRHPRVQDTPPDDRATRWLVKARDGSGGSGVRLWEPGQSSRPRRPVYWQEYVPGEPCAALYVARRDGVVLLGATRQLVGERWLHAGGFQYCGSVGPLVLPDAMRWAFERLGETIGTGCGLRGLFGVDCILHVGEPWPVEVNPRYTASVEVHEYATGLAALAHHRQAFDPEAPAPGAASAGPVVGKAILFARESLVFPDEGPWQEVLRQPGAVAQMPAFADVPRPGEQVPRGKPVLTFFARAATEAACVAALQKQATALDQCLFGR